MLTWDIFSYFGCHNHIRLKWLFLANIFFFCIFQEFRSFNRNCILWKIISYISLSFQLLKFVARSGVLLFNVNQKHFILKVGIALELANINSQKRKLRQLHLFLSNSIIISLFFTNKHLQSLKIACQVNLFKLWVPEFFLFYLKMSYFP